MAQRLVLLSIPNLTRRDVTPGALASLESLAVAGKIVEVEPAFPGLASSSFASLVTGMEAVDHGVIGDSYFDRGTGRIVRPPTDAGHTAPRLWDRLAEKRPHARSLLWLAPASEGARVDVCLRRGPGDSLLAEPTTLAKALEGQLGPPPSDALKATSWSLRAAALALREQEPDLSLIRIPLLGEVARRHGPDGREANRAVCDLEPLLAEFLAAVPTDTSIVAVTESIVTPVSGRIYPNRILRELGLLRLVPRGGGFDVDLATSPAFALADQQLCHIYLNDTFQAAIVASAFCDVFSEGIARVASGRQRARLGLDHPRAGDVVLVAESDQVFEPDWWDDPSEAPIPNGEGSGLEVNELHGLEIPCGAQGSPMPSAEYCGVAIANCPDLLPDDSRLRLSRIGAVLADRMCK